MRGISFEIPNTYGRHLFHILEATPIVDLNWKIGDGEAYLIEDNTLGNPLFSTTSLLPGRDLQRAISNKDYYLIFVDLKGFPTECDVVEITTYQEFMESKCQFVLLIVDSTYVTIYSKEPNTTKQIFDLAFAAGHQNIEYITDDNDNRTTLIAF